MVPNASDDRSEHTTPLPTIEREQIVELERLNPQLFEKFRDFIYDKSGIRIDEHKVTLLSNRIRSRLKAGKFADFDVYYQYLTSAAGASELSDFLDAVTTNETFFFRTLAHFEWLAGELIADAVAAHRAGQRPNRLRIWSAGCANGAEPYSIAICLAENRYRLRDWSLEVLGTDISETMLQEAREGVFKPRAMEAVDERRRRRHFRYLEGDDKWRVRPEIKSLVRFERQNLMERPPAPGFDCIFIRNVLIYFDHASKALVLKNLFRALVDGGFLVVGPSEGVYGMLDPLRKVTPLIYQKMAGKDRAGSTAEGQSDE